MGEQPTRRVPRRQGFTFTRPQGCWVICDECEEDHLVLGSPETADVEARDWALQHQCAH
jgi:hypothetical protein